jgi:hypothetical protein
LHLGGLGSVRLEPYPPLPKARPLKARNGLVNIAKLPELLRKPS